MAKFGCCLNLASIIPTSINGKKQDVDFAWQLKEGLSILSKNGYDFAELTVSTIINLSEHEFENAKEIIQNSSIKTPAFNGFIPPSLSLTGPNVSYQKIEEYLDKAMSRIHQIDGHIIVFGSGGARQVPKGFSMNSASDQIMKFLNLCNKYASTYNLTIAIEPLNKLESNIINTVDEAIKLAETVNLPHIRVLADTYHMFMENESYDILQPAAKWLAHIHISDKERLYPGQNVKDGIDFNTFFNALKSAGYDGRISLECKYNDLRIESAYSLTFVKNVWESL